MLIALSLFRLSKTINHILNNFDIRYFQSAPPNLLTLSIRSGDSNTLQCRRGKTDHLRCRRWVEYLIKINAAFRWSTIDRFLISFIFKQWNDKWINLIDWSSTIFCDHKVETSRKILFVDKIQYVNIQYI